MEWNASQTREPRLVLGLKLIFNAGEILSDFPRLESTFVDQKLLPHVQPFPAMTAPQGRLPNRLHHLLAVQAPALAKDASHNMKGRAIGEMGIRH